MPRSEAQTRFELIDPALETRGWNRATDIQVEVTVKVIRKIVKPFEKAGTGVLEAGQLWKAIDEPKALETLRQGGQPAELLRLTKQTLLAA